MGSTNRRPTPEMVDELRRFAWGEGFDEQSLPGLDSEALDSVEFLGGERHRVVRAGEPA